MLVAALRRPEVLPTFPLQQWDLLIRQARRADLHARLARLAEAAGVLDAIPEQPRGHLIAAMRVADKIAQTTRWEVNQIRSALEDLDAPVVIMKGAAYLLAELPLASGRLFYDVDVLVPEGTIARAESLLKLHGWGSIKTSAYDQRYYRRWMHELPPMRHGGRETVLDLHHNILPRTARMHPDGAKLIAASVPLAGNAPLRVLAPADMVLHAATHLFHEGETHHALRDLFDLDGLLRHFGTDAGFWAALVPRARALDLLRPLYYALRHTRRLFATPIPADTLAAADAGAPGAMVGTLMDVLFSRGLRAPHPSCADWLSAPARFGLYLRGHWLRMPLHLLLPHLIHQAFATKSP